MPLKVGQNFNRSYLKKLEQTQGGTLRHCGEEGKRRFSDLRVHVVEAPRDGGGARGAQRPQRAAAIPPAPGGRERHRGLPLQFGDA